MEQKTERESKHTSLQNEVCREDDMLLSVATQVQWDISAKVLYVLLSAMSQNDHAYSKFVW